MREKVKSGKFELNKLKDTFNTADLLTKHLSKMDMLRCVEGLASWYAEGKSEIAPHLSSLEEYDLMPILLEQLSIKCYHVC